MEKQNLVKVGNYNLRKDIIDVRHREYCLELMGSDTALPDNVLNKLTRDIPEDIRNEVKKLISRGF